jgi:integrase
VAVLKLTEKLIRELPFSSGIHRDTDVKGLMVICHATVKSFAVQGDVRRNGRHVRTVRVKIDRCDRIGLAEAKRRAKALMSEIQRGCDPTAGPEETGITLAQALDAHLKERELRPSTIRGYTEHVNRHLTRLRGRAVADITRADCRELMDFVTERHGRTTAIGAMRTLRTLINTARRMDETIGPNPTEALRIPMPPIRQVAPLDIAEWWRRTEHEMSPRMRDLQRAILLTGARRTSILTAKREHVDAEKGTLTFAHMKVGDPLIFPMGKFLSAMLEGRMFDDAPLNSPWLWPSPNSATGYMREPKRPGFPAAHALRHHCRTLMIAAGVPYAESALLLGHTLPGASGGYVHRSHLAEALRPHAQRYEDFVLAAAGALQAA